MMLKLSKPDLHKQVNGDDVAYINNWVPCCHILCSVKGFEQGITRSIEITVNEESLLH